MATHVTCDAADCDAAFVPNGGPVPFYSSVIEVCRPDHPCDDCGGIEAEVIGLRVDACSIEHLRIALAHKIAEITDEHQATS